MTGEASKGHKKKNMRQRNKKQWKIRTNEEVSS